MTENNVTLGPRQVKKTFKLHCFLDNSHKPHSIPKTQRRIRHIQSIIGRNICWMPNNSCIKENQSTSSEPSTPTLLTSTSTSLKRSESSTSLTALTTAIPTATAAALMEVKDSSLVKGAYKKQESAHLLGLLDTFFTLHTGTVESPAFYKSEMISNTTNPTFRSLPCPLDDWTNWYAVTSGLVIVRMWARHANPESTGQHTEPVLGYQNSHEDESDFILLLEWQADLNALVWIGKKDKDLHYTFPENTLILKLQDGFYSAPDIKSWLTNQKSNIKRSSNGLLLAEYELAQDNASIHSERSNQFRKKKSYTYNNIMKLNTIKDFIFDTQMSSDQVRQAIQEALEQNERGFTLSRQLNQRKSQLVEKESLIMQQKKSIQQKLSHIKQKKELIEKRKMEIAQSLARCTSNTEDLKENEDVLEKNIKMRQSMFHTLNRRKKELIADLFSIYPIEQSFDDSQQFHIRGIYLANSVYDGQNEELVATALGFTAHLVSMLAYYLEIPLRYPTIPMGSKAYIRDLVSLITGSRDFPLYSKGVDRYRFEFGVFLLNKNIEQLMNAYGLIVMDLRHTLPNIHYFIQAILTTSVTSGPTSMSVLSISSYASGSRNNSTAIRQDHNHLTLQPNNTPLPQPPSPSASIRSSNTLTTRHSPKASISYTSGTFLNTPQAMAAPAILDTITTSSNHHAAL